MTTTVPTFSAPVGAAHPERTTLPVERDLTGLDPAEPPATAPPSRRGRVVGIDIARALALIGMFTQHVIVSDADGAGSTGWVAWFFRESAGRAAVLFFLLSGVSLAMIHRNGSRTSTPAVLRRRGLLLLGGGILLTLTIWSASILQHYGVAFLLAPWLLRLRWRGLAAITATGLVGGPIALLWLPRIGDDVAGWWSGSAGSWLLSETWSLLVTGIYPMVIWIGFFTLGMLIGRTRLDTRRVGTALAAGGIAATLLFGIAARSFADHHGDAYGDQYDTSLDEGFEDGFDETPEVESVGEAGDGPLSPTGATSSDIDELTDAELGAKVREQQAAYELGDDDYDDYDDSEFAEYDDFGEYADAPIAWRSLYDTTGHSGAMGWTLQTSGIATAILGLALLIPRRLQTVLRPLTILGSMSLTAYLVHIALVNDVWDAHVVPAGWSVIVQEWAFAGVVATMIGACVIFHRWLGTGPLEKLLKHFTLRPGDRPSQTPAPPSPPAA